MIDLDSLLFQNIPLLSHSKSMADAEDYFEVTA
jgi:hypothetical protein